MRENQKGESNYVRKPQRRNWKIKPHLLACPVLGKRLGRPPLSKELKQSILDYHKQGLSQRAIVEKTKASKGTIHLVLKTQKQKAKPRKSAGRGK